MTFRLLLLAIICAATPAHAQKLYTFGDSNTICSQGTGVVNGMTGCWAALATYDLMTSGVNKAANNNTVVSQADDYYATALVPADTVYSLIGTNDQRLNGTSADKRANYARSYACMLGYAALDVRKARTHASWTFTGTWSNTVAYGIGKSSQVPGNTASFSFTGTSVRICGIMQNAQTGVASVAVDGVTVGTWAFTGVNGAQIDAPGYAPMPFDISGLSDGPHTVTITHVSGAYVFLDWWASASVGRTVIAGTIPRMTAAGYATYGGSDALVAAYSAEVVNVVTTLNTLFGAGVKVADVCNDIDPATDLLTDGIHLDQSGHWKTAAAFKNAP